MAAKKPDVDLEITSAVMIDGKMIRPNKGKESQVTVSSSVATDLMRRGKAKFLTAEEPAAGDGKGKGKGDEGKGDDDKPKG